METTKKYSISYEEEQNRSLYGWPRISRDSHMRNGIDAAMREALREDGQDAIKILFPTDHILVCPDNACEELQPNPQYTVIVLRDPEPGHINLTIPQAHEQIRTIWEASGDPSPFHTWLWTHLKYEQDRHYRAQRATALWGANDRQKAFNNEARSAKDVRPGLRLETRNIRRWISRE